MQNTRWDMKIWVLSNSLEGFELEWALSFMEMWVTF
jgi:hypothetical protein